ncbi:MAG: hypothetical protein AAF514_22770, partial [Verrucomicrobiota bacterium]
ERSFVSILLVQTGTSGEARSGENWRNGEENPIPSLLWGTRIVAKGDLRFAALESSGIRDISNKLNDGGT